MSDYNLWSRFLHRLALGIRSVSEASFDIEKQSLAKKLPDAAAGQHVFVTGLARSGTTMLMRAMHETGQFCSLTYRDMPFVLAPNTWASLSQHGKKDMSKTERAHADGVLVDFDSPEALEEVFWRVFAGERYIHPDRLSAMSTSAEVRDRFKTYVAMILHRYDSGRYLSKNNNNMVRLNTIDAVFPNASVLVPFRRPEQQALSLFNQHRRFVDMHEEDKFSEAYMGWLVHHEFGRDHRPFEWGLKYSGDLSPDSLDYWLAQWLGVYSHILAQMGENNSRMIPVSYETLCEHTAPSWQSLCELLALGEAPQPDFSLRQSELPEPVNPALLDQAVTVYDALSALCQQRLLA